MQLFQIYRKDPEKAIAYFKEGASADWNLTIQEIYEKQVSRLIFRKKGLKVLQVLFWI